MNAIPNPLRGSTSQSPPKWHTQVLGTCEALAGPPTLIVVILTFFTENTRTIAICSGVALLAAVFVRFFSRFLDKHSLLVAMPWLLTGGLAIVLVLVVFPNRAKQQSKLLASSWLEWQKELEQAATKCKKEAPRCLSDAISPVLGRRPQPNQRGDVTGLASDLIAGQLMLANDNIRDVLNTRLGVGDRFIGSGFSEPVDQTDFLFARVSEYFVPNLSDSSAHVWQWNLEPGQLVDHKPLVDNKLIDVLLKFPPLNHSDFSRNWSWISRDHLGSNDPHPALVRFALLDPKKKKYSGCLGRADATRAFMSSLGEVYQKTVTEAARNSGYAVAGKTDEPGVRLFVWVYTPNSDGIVARATWRNVLSHFGEWTKAEMCAKESGAGPSDQI